MEEKFKIWLDIAKYALIIGATVIIVIFFYKSCSGENKNDLGIRIDTVTVYKKEIPPPVVIHDTISRRQKIYIPYSTIDSLVINKLLAERDSLSKLLDSQNVEIISSLDTVWHPTNDTFKIRHWDLTNDWLFEARYAERIIPIQQNTNIFPIREPDIAFYEHPVFTGTLGITLGLIAGFLLGGK